MSNIEKPRNPFATEDFKKAVEHATESMSDTFRQIGKQMEANFPFMDFSDTECVEELYCGKVKLDYNNGLGAWDDFVHILIAHGYEVTIVKCEPQIEISFREVA